MAKKPTKTELTIRMRNCMTRMAQMPVTLDHAHMLMGLTTKPLDECLLDETTRPVLFAMHALLSVELAEAHASQARDHILEKVRAKTDGNDL